MSNDGKKVGAGARVDLDAALRQWPEPPAEEADARAAAIMARLDPAAAASTDRAAEALSEEDLFAAPLPRSSDDGELGEVGEVEPRQRPAKRSGAGLREMTKELTRMAKELGPAPAPASSQSADARAKLDSGIVDLAAAAAADPGGAARAQTTPLASEDLFAPPAPAATETRAATKVEPTPEPTPEPARPAPRLVAVAVPASSTAKTDPPKATPPAEQAKVRERILGAFAAFAAAAALFLLMRQPASAPSATGTPLAAAPAASATVAPVTPAEDPALAKAPPPPSPAAVDPNALPAAPVGDGNEKLAQGGKPPAATKPGAAHAPPAAAPPAKPTPPPADKPQQLATAPNDLNAAMRGSVGDDKDKTPAASLSGSGSMGNVPQKPSQGAVTGALGAVLPQARGCLGPDDPISRAAIVFTSNGTVQSVSVSGAAAGTDVEACIKTALGKAKIQPFAEPTYTANVTIRH